MKIETSRYAITYDHISAEFVLINKGNITSFLELEEFETVHTYRRLSELALAKKKFGKFDAQHLKDVHSYIFQDVYLDKKEMEKSAYEGKLPLRGEFRIENIAKGNFQFANALFIDKSLSYLLEVELKKDNYLKNLSFDKFIKKVSYYLAEINVLHPFREGNGRSSREFIRQLSLNANYFVDWSLLDNRKDEFMEAMILSVGNTSKLEGILAEITQKMI